MKRNASTNVPGRNWSATIIAARLHGVSDALREDEQPVGEERERDRERPAARISVLKMSWLERDEDRPAEPLRDHERRDRRDRDRRDGCDPEAGDDRRQRERQLDAQERLRARQPHPRAASSASGGHGAQPRDHVAVEDEQRVR